MDGGSMAQVRSNDGTMIAYDRSGTGPAVVLVGGGLDGSENAAIAAELARGFTVYNYARRGRGGSGDTAPYAVARDRRHPGADRRRRWFGARVRRLRWWRAGAGSRCRRLGDRQDRGVRGAVHERRVD